MTYRGAFMFVLHSHLPYARLAGRWPHGEEWIHEAAAETYVPLLETLYDLAEEGVPYKINIGITPILAEQLADPLILQHFEDYLDDRIAAARRDILFFSGLPVDSELPMRAEGRVVVTDEKQTAIDSRIVTEQRADVGDLAHAAADGERHEDVLGRARDDVEQDRSRFVRGGDVEEGELVGFVPVVAGRDLDRIAGVTESDEVHAFDDPPVLDVEAGNDAFGERHHDASPRPTRSAVARSIAPV